MTPESMLTLERGPGEPVAEAEVAEAHTLFRKHGSLVLPASFDRLTVERLSAAFDERYVNMPSELRAETCLAVGDRRYLFTVDIEGPFADPAIYASPIVLPIVKRLLGEDAILQSCGAVCAFPGAPMQHIHRDFPELFPSVSGLGMMLPVYAVHVVIPLVDLDETTGTTAMWEGSHKVQHLDPGRHAAQSAVPVDLTDAALPFIEVGDCYFMDYRLRHAGTPNRSDRPRTILYLVYSRPWFKDRANFRMQSPLSIDATTLAAVPPTLTSLFAAATNG